MCGRYVLYGPQSRYQAFFDAQLLADFGDNYNIAPTAMTPVIRLSPEGQRVLSMLRWGLIPRWAKDPGVGARLNNARGETVAEKPSFRDAFRKRRCIVPASGFYEWHTTPSGKQPYYVSLRSGDPLAMAGLWEAWRAPDGTIVRTFCIVTTGPNEVMAPIHDRMPVLLHQKDFVQWLSPDADPSRVAELIEPFPSEGMQAWSVSKAVNRASSSGPDLILPTTTVP